MNHHRLLVVPAVVAVALCLTACIRLPLPLPGPNPHPSSSTSTDVDPSAVDPAAAEDLMRSAIPAPPADFEVYEVSGLDDESFGSDWSVVDHDAKRVARVLLQTESPGWADYSRGPGFYFDVEIVLMESEGAAAAAYNEIAGAATRPYSYTSDDGELRTDYSPRTEPSGRWPFGTVEQYVDQTWSSGSRSSGWMTVYLAGAFIVEVSASAVPGDDSAAGLEAYADRIVPLIIGAADALPAQLAALS